jgi:uncharacterized protein YecE (DUF72 family)
MARLWLGTSGWSYRHWSGQFYPEELPARRWFAYYAQHFPTVEINASFYREPNPRTYDNWREGAPNGFRFAVKAHQYVTHRKRLSDPTEPLGRILRGARRLEDHLGPILYQLPPAFRRTPENAARLDAFLELLPRDLDHVVEFRHSSWWTDDTLVELRAHSVAFCWHDMGGADVPLAATAPFAYIRFHGGDNKYAGNYPENALAAHARRIEAIARNVNDVWIYFNNDIGGHAIHNAKTLARLLNAPLPAQSEPVAI